MPSASVGALAVRVWPWVGVPEIVTAPVLLAPRAPMVAEVAALGSARLRVKLVVAVVPPDTSVPVTRMLR